MVKKPQVYFLPPAGPIAMALLGSTIQLYLVVDNLGSFTPSWSLLHSWVLSKRAKHDNSSLLTTFLGVSFGVNGWIKWRTHASASVAVLQHLLNFSPRWVALNQIASLGYLDKLTWTKRAVRCAKKTNVKMLKWNFQHGGMTSMCRRVGALNERDFWRLCAWWPWPQPYEILETWWCFYQRLGYVQNLFNNPVDFGLYS